MENTKREVYIFLFRKMCLRELEKAKDNLQIHLKKVNEMFLHIHNIFDNSSYNAQDFLIPYDAALTDLTYIADIIRKFNISCEIKPLKYDEPLTIEAEKGNDKEHFPCLGPNMTKYKASYEGNCVITYIQNKEEKLVYINDTDNAEYMDCVALLKDYFLKSPKKFDRMPKQGDVFGLYVKGYMLRAVRENDQYHGSKSDSSWNAYLIDVGEVVKITSEIGIYFLPHQCLELPSQAILCKLEMVNSNINYLEKYLNNILYVRHKFVVLAKTECLLYVNLIESTNPFFNTCGVNNNTCGINSEIGIINPFRQYFCGVDDINKTTNENTELMFSNALFTENINQTLSHEVTHNSSQNFTCTSTSCVQQYKNLCGKISTCDINSKMLGSHNRCYQNLNYQISKRITLQDLYSDILGKCIDNSSASEKCKMQHRRKESVKSVIQRETINQIVVQDGNKKRYAVKKIMNNFENNTSDSKVLTEENKPIHYIKNKYVYPLVGQFITLIPTHIVKIELFFAHHHIFKSRYQYSLRELIRQMNKPEEIQSYVKIRRPLEQFEFVIAMYKDGFWYRARVTEIYDEISIKVFYVDYGNSYVITVHQVRKWEPRFEILPFQVIRCRIAGIKRTSLSISGIAHVNKMLLDKSLRAKIIKKSNENLLDVKLIDSEECDIGDQLVLLGYATKM